MSDKSDKPVSMRKTPASAGAGAARPTTILVLTAMMLLSGLAAVVAALTLYGQHGYLVRTLAKSQPAAKITTGQIATVSGTAGQSLTSGLTSLVGQTLTSKQISTEADQVGAAVKTAIPTRNATTDEIKTQVDKTTSAVSSQLKKVSGALTSAQVSSQSKDLASTVKSNLTDLQKSQLSPQQIQDKANKAPHPDPDPEPPAAGRTRPGRARRLRGPALVPLGRSGHLGARQLHRHGGRIHLRPATRLRSSRRLQVRWRALRPVADRRGGARLPASEQGLVRRAPTGRRRRRPTSRPVRPPRPAAVGTDATPARCDGRPARWPFRPANSCQARRDGGVGGRRGSGDGRIGRREPPRRSRSSVRRRSLRARERLRARARAKTASKSRRTSES